VAWDGTGGQLRLRANFADAALSAEAPPRGRLLWGNGNGERLDPWTASWWLALQKTGTDHVYFEVNVVCH
jgi:hypothetical protein